MLNKLMKTQGQKKAVDTLTQKVLDRFTSNFAECL